ncbi:hypothetical protein IWX81_001686 [Salinibacterium sp. CAN_S4]|uniref:DUF559 domain-containing protein n=1 Tax=Salinibacterium sp. CAN_S4 TaxID=2787727 RepID=UPI0018F0506C
MHPSPLPEKFASRPFTVAEARTAGVSASRLRALDLDAGVWGLRTRRSDAPISLDDRCRMLALRVPPGAFFSHATAALLLGAPLTLETERSSRLHVAVAAPAARLHSSALVGHRLAIDLRDVVSSRGIRHTSAARTWMDLSADLSLGDLVAVGDYLIHRSRPITSQQELHTRVSAAMGQRGVSIAREAVGLIRDGAESRPESHLRVILVRGGLPEPRINHTIVHTETGRSVRPDFLFPDEKLILEYQGDYHRTARQWRMDMTRRSRLEAAGWYVMELNADDLRDPVELLRRIRLVLARRSVG